VQEWHRVPGTSFLVDRFGKGTEGLPCRSWFLTHFHADHWKGLTSRFKAGVHTCSFKKPSPATDRVP
jgi:DNA cross-link repair 1A protein